EARSQESGISAISRAAKLSEDTAERERSARLLDQPQGIELVRKEGRLFLDAAEAANDRLIEVSPALKLWKKRGELARNFFFLDVHGPNGLCERLHYQGAISNTAKHDLLEIILFRFTSKHEEIESPATRIAERKFVPFITLEDRVLWKA